MSRVCIDIKISEFQLLKHQILSAMGVEYKLSMSDTLGAIKCFPLTSTSQKSECPLFVISLLGGLSS